MDQATIARLRNAAQTGDAAAQYHLAAVLSAAGAADEADAWLNRAAQSGSPDALYTIATRSCGTLEGIATSLDAIRRAADGGSSAAANLLGVLHRRGWGVDEDDAAASRFAVAAARCGDPVAMASLAVALLVDDHNSVDGAALLRQASQKSAAAAAVRVRRFADGASDDPTEIDRLAAMLRQARYPIVEELARALAGRKTAATDGALNAAVDWDRAAAALVAALAADQGADAQSADGVARHSISTTPAVWTSPKVWPTFACDYVVARAAGLLGPSRIVDSQTGVSRADPYRTSLTAVFAPVDLDIAIVRLQALLARRCSENLAQAEFLSVLRYAPGQEYRAHFDWLPDDTALTASGGQRVATALISLNANYGGGETDFTEIQYRHRGAPGDLLCFRNVDDAGAPDLASRHAGAAVTHGAKWIASQWFRATPFRF